jgi:hypothetical protein
MDKSNRLKALLECGYFPEELPPPFCTYRIAIYRKYVEDNWGPIDNVPRSRAETFSYPRYGRARRTLHIVNPLSQFFVSKCISDNWVKIRQFLNKSNFVLQNIEIAKNKERAISKPDFHSMDWRLVEISSRYNHALTTDISRFYGTVYTHAIPWALHGKTWCKANLHRPIYNASIGNLIVVAVRKGQDGQTMGIPVGPDTSRIISEVIASAIDQRVQSPLKLDRYNAVRNVDDWYVGFDSAGEVEKAISFIAMSHQEFELEINNEKTQSFGPNDHFHTSWPKELREFKFLNSNTREQRRSIEHYFAKIFEFYDKHPRQNVLDYGVKRSREIRVYRNNWSLYEALLLKCVRVNPTALPAFAQILVSYNATGYPIGRERISKFVMDTIREHAPTGHHGEVAWALFLAKGLRLTISSDVARLLGRINSSVCALLSLDLFHRGLIPNGLDTRHWRSYMNSAGLTSNMWLLAYEADLKGWLVGSPPNYVDGHRYFSVLKRRNIYFYDEVRNVPHIRHRRRRFIRFPHTFLSFGAYE